MNMGSKATLGAGGGLDARAGMPLGVTPKTHYEIECVGEDGVVKWVEAFDNLVVTTGLNELISDTFKASGYTATWYIGLTNATPTFAAGDTMASHGGWTESSAYTEANRQALTLGTVSGGSANNSAAKGVFSINGTATIGGAFVANNNTKGGSTGTLYGGGAFTEGNRSVVNGDTLNVTITTTMT